MKIGEEQNCVLHTQARKAAERDDTDVPPVPVTVRQLEALIRISEALAKMALQVRAPSTTTSTRAPSTTTSTRARRSCSCRLNLVGPQSCQDLCVCMCVRGGH
jgi:hypothetical protein